MLLLEYLKNVKEKHIIFEYGYYGINGSFMKDETLCMEGNVEEVISFVEATGSLRFLFACSGECNDFEVSSSVDQICLRYIDFR